MAEELTRTLTVKRTSKKKSGYSVIEKDEEYYLETAPNKARVNPGDRVVGINGIPAEDFHDEDDANELIESIRIVVVPQENLEKYDGIMQRGGIGEEPSAGDEEYEEYDRSSRFRPPKVLPQRVPVISHCNNCGRDNEDLSVDDEGDLVCEGCGHVIDPPPSDDDVIHVCKHCDAVNRNLEPDEDGDLVCQTCGHVIPDHFVAGGVKATCEHCNHVNHNLEPDEDGDLVCEGCGHVIEPDDGIIHVCPHCDHRNKDLERDEEGDLVCQECGYVIPDGEDNDNEQPAKHTVYVCPDCDHKNINPEPDHEGDRVCEECACILPEKDVVVCSVCEHPNIDPIPNRDGDFLCEHCNSALDVEEQYRQSLAEKVNALNGRDSRSQGIGQQFDDRGRPITNQDGKKLTPADMFSPGDVITVSVGKSNPKQDPGLKIEERNGKFYVRKVPSGGLFAKTPVIAGDKVLELNDVDSRDFQDVNELKKILKDESKITIVVLRRDPYASDSSASSVDYDTLRAIDTPATSFSKSKRASKHHGSDDDTAPCNGDDCGCDWCPQCQQ